MTARDDRQRRAGSAGRGIGLLLVMFVVMLAFATVIAATALWLVG